MNDCFLFQIFDKFVPCLKDSNVKVNLHALTGMNVLIPPLKDYLSPVIALTITTVASNLSSKNKEIYDAASVILDALMEVTGKILHVDTHYTL